MKTDFSYASFIFFLILSSCDSTIMVDNYIDINNHWEKDQVKEFKFQVEKDGLYTIYLGLRHNNEYQFANIHLITAMTDNQKVKIDTLEFPIAESSGKFLGKGFGQIKELKWPYKKGILLKSKVIYTFSIQQGMRKDTLIGIEDVSLTITKETNDNY